MGKLFRKKFYPFVFRIKVVKKNGKCFSVILFLTLFWNNVIRYQDIVIFGIMFYVLQNCFEIFLYRIDITS